MPTTPSRCRTALGSALALCLAALPVASTPQTISGTTPLSFGTFIAGSGGTISLTPGGIRAHTGGVLPVGQAAGYTAAQFTVLGTPNASYSITLPGDNVIVLTDGNSHTMAINSFVASPSSTGTLSGGGSQLVRV